jgi:hypothetical protein
MSLSAQLRAAGAPEVEWRRAEAFEQLYGPTGAVQVARMFEPGLDEKPPEGALSKFFNVLQRPASAVVGGLTGALGLERQGTDERAPEGGAGGAEAIDRFMKGLTGQEQYRSKEFGALQYDRDEASTGEKVFKSSVGFLLDVALDPLTYLSAGGTILGRRLGSEALEGAVRVGLKKEVDDTGATLLSRISDDTMEETIRLSAAEGGLNGTTAIGRVRLATARDSIAENTRGAERVLAEAQYLARNLDDIPADATIDDAIAMARSMTKTDEAGNVIGNYLPDLFEDALSYGAASQFVVGGKSAAHRFLSKAIGTEGEELWRMLPVDMQGGIRVRVPFVRRQVGDSGVRTPLAFRLPGTGNIVEKTPFLRNAAELTNRARDFVRTTPGLRAVSRSGRHGELWQKMAASVYGKRVGRTIDYSDYKQMVEANVRKDILERAITRESGEAAAKIVGPLRSAKADFGDAFIDADGNGAFYEELANPRILDDAQEKLLEESDPLRYAAYTVANVLRQEMENMVEYIKLAVPNFKALEAEYFPRIWDLFESVGGGSTGRGNLERLREAHAAIIGEDGGVLRWFTPKEISDRYGVEVFKVDPEQAILKYVYSVKRVMNDEFMKKELINRGVALNPNLLRDVPDLTAAVRAIAPLRQRLRAGASTIRGYQRLQTLEDFAERDRELYRILGKDAFNSARGQALRRRLASVSQYSDDELNRLLLSLSQWGRRVMDEGFEGTSPTGQRVLEFLDGTFVEEVAGLGFRVRDGAGRFLTVRGNWANRAQDAQMFVGRAEASQGAAARLVDVRNAEYQALVKETNVAAKRRIADSIKEIERLGAWDGNAFNPQNIPDNLEEEYFEGLVNILREFGDFDNYRTRRIEGEQYRKVVEDMGLRRIGSGSSVRMRDGIATAMQTANLFAAEGLMDDIARMFRAPREKVNWLDNYYRPFYALQKSLMTSQRGPGYVLRNISGGVWNAYLVGVSPGHFKLAAQLKVMEAAARRRALDLDDTAEAQKAAFIGFFEDAVLKKFGDRQGGDLLRSWVAWETQGQRGGTLSSFTESMIAGNMASVQLRDSMDRAVKDMRLDPQRGVVYARELPRGTRVLQWMVEENPWARVMGGASNQSEDFLRLATFLRGRELYGLEDGGYAASLLVKASQFDYSDLSDFEARFLKMVLPFYTWTRNNVPLQFRAALMEPGKVKRALAINEELADLFGEEEDPESPLPAYIRQRFGWTVRPDVAQTAMGDKFTVGLIWGEPLADVNTLFRSPSSPTAAGRLNTVNWREIVNMMNPAFKSVAEAMEGIEAASGGSIAQTEDAPKWLAPFDRDNQVSGRTLRAVRENVPYLAMIERLFPRQLGNDRLERRLVTSRLSALAGVPVYTLDPYQARAELVTRQRRLDGEMRRLLGENTTEKAAFARALLEIGVTDSELEVLESVVFGASLAEAPLEKLDPDATRATMQFITYVRSLAESGVPRAEYEALWRDFDPWKFSSSRRRTSRPLTVEELAELGLTPEDIGRMSDEERARFLREYFG